MTIHTDPARDPRFKAAALASFVEADGSKIGTATTAHPAGPQGLGHRARLMIDDWYRLRTIVPRQVRHADQS